MEILIGILTLALVAFVVVAFLLFIFGNIIEPTFMLLFNRPVYVHFYPFKKQLGPMHQRLLESNSRFYRRLSPVRQGYFRHRVASFIRNYTFAGRDGLQVTDEMKVKIAATAVMLTFGMRKYLPTIVSVIVVYPDVFASANGESHHKGEFNPLAGAVVFSWKHFMEGWEYDNDNLNLGLHEFAHVLHFDSVRKRRPGSSAVIYSDMFNKIMQYLAKPEHRKRLAGAGYFREYAYTNQYEFIAVLLEHFFETPTEFRQKFPELYTMVKKMINYREG